MQGPVGHGEGRGGKAGFGLGLFYPVTQGPSHLTAGHIDGNACRILREEHGKARL